MFSTHLKNRPVKLDHLLIACHSNTLFGSLILKYEDSTDRFDDVGCKEVPRLALLTGTKPTYAYLHPTGWEIPKIVAKSLDTMQLPSLQNSDFPLPSNPAKSNCLLGMSSIHRPMWSLALPWQPWRMNVFLCCCFRLADHVSVYDVGFHMATLDYCVAPWLLHVGTHSVTVIQGPIQTSRRLDMSLTI